MDAKMIFIPLNEFEVMLEKAIERIENRKKLDETVSKQKEILYSVNQVAKKLRRGHSTIKKLVAQGIIRTTPDGLISEKSINDYLSNT